MKKTYTKKQIQEAISYWKKQLAEGNYRKVNEAVEVPPSGEYGAYVKYVVQELLAELGDEYAPDSCSLAKVRGETTGDYRVAEADCVRLCDEILDRPPFNANKAAFRQITDLYYRVGAMLDWLNEKDPGKLDEIVDYAVGYDDAKLSMAWAFINNELEDDDYAD